MTLGILAAALRHSPVFALSRNLGDSSQRNDHRWHPLLAIMRLVMVRRQGPAVVRKDALAAVVRCQPYPSAISEGQCLRDHVPRVIKEVGAELIGDWIVSDDLQPAHVLFSDTAVRRVHDETPIRAPLEDVGLHDRYARVL